MRLETVFKLFQVAFGLCIWPGLLKIPQTEKSKTSFCLRPEADQAGYYLHASDPAWNKAVKAA